MQAQRHRQQLLFERFLHRAQTIFGPRVLVKGGVALEVRTESARATRDVDLTIWGKPAEVRAGILSIASMTMDDWFEFGVLVHPTKPALTGDGLRYGGERFRVQAHLAGKPTGDGFSVDVTFGGNLAGPPDLLPGSRILDPLGMDAIVLRAVNVPTHLAEKLHAFSAPGRKSRVKDLPDMALLAGLGPLDADALRQALAHTFTTRKTHALPPSLPPSPSEWASGYRDLVARHGLPWKSLDALHAAVAAFFDPLLGRHVGHVAWNPATWHWEWA
ncbi:MAG: nucleotidyl transferase AbiEii/AbiGii toxin family protein [Myxococcales bacterium]|nr:nucleotidyl transferase AbiEii/AbiGii toxin family protein [Myxococcales bacterium]